MRVIWEVIESTVGRLYRARVPGGWLLLWKEWISGYEAGVGGSMFYPDPEHQWDGNSLP